MSWFAEHKSEVFMAAGLAIMAMVLLRIWMRASRRRRKDNSPIVRAGDQMKKATPQKHDSTRLAEFLAEIDRQKVMMYDMVREFQADVDTRTRVLQQYTVTAERLAERLEKAIKRAEQLGIDPDKEK